MNELGKFIKCFGDVLMVLNMLLINYSEFTAQVVINSSVKNI